MLVLLGGGVRLGWQKGTYRKGDIELLVEIFRQLHWAGASGGGFPVLAGFTDGDFGHLPGSQRKPIFFSASSKRCLLYAGRDWAGGETARAVRIAFEDLDNFLSSAEYRRKVAWRAWQALADCLGREPALPPEVMPRSNGDASYRDLRKLWTHLKMLGLKPWFCLAPAVEPVDFTEEWLRRRIDSLRLLRERCNQPVASFAHGVVYAVRFYESDLPNLKVNNKDLLSLKRVSPDRIVAKAIVLPEAEQIIDDQQIYCHDSDEPAAEKDGGVFDRARRYARSLPN